MSTAAIEKSYTVEEYIRHEQETGIKHAYLNGKLTPMAGGTIPHNLISGNIFGLLHHLLFDKEEFQIFSSDQKIYLPKYNYYVYPDVVVVCGIPEISDEEAHAITNPILVIETLSTSTQRYDKGQKFFEYQSLPSLQEYVVFRQDKAEAQSMFKEAPNVWHTASVESIDENITFKSIGISLAMRNIYRKVNL